MNRLLSLENILKEEKAFEELESFLWSELFAACIVCGTVERNSDSVEGARGLYVCVSFLLKHLRVELQAVGRTARQGNRGTARLVLHAQKTVETLKKERETKLFDSEEDYWRKVFELVYLGDKVKEFYKFVRATILNKYSGEGVFQTALLSQMHKKWSFFLLRNIKHLNEDNKEAFEYAYEKFTESLRQNPNRITNIHYLLKAVNESMPEQTRYELVVEKLIHCLIDDPPGEGGYIDVQSPDSNFIDYLNRGIASLLNKKEYRSQLIMAIELFVKTIEQIRLYSIPFSLGKQRHFEENNEKFDYYEKQVELLDK